MKIHLDRDVLLIRGDHSFLLVGVVQEPFALCLETRDDEWCQGIDAGDLVAVSAPEDGDPMQGLILLELVRKFHVPVIVLPKGHPGSSRLQMVVSAGAEISMNCSIERGTHPEQHLLCSSDELSGMHLQSDDSGVTILSCPSHAQVYRIPDPVLVHAPIQPETGVRY
ncbi:MAG: alpha/beta hydrolase [Methanospirillaceae archaeon]|nr:alpha/beta hydrolase [Methanospirillaceae archaeon]